MSAVGDLVATMGMNISPFQSAAGAVVARAQQLGSQVNEQMQRVRGAMSSALGGIGLGTVAGLVGGGGLVAGLYESIKVAGDAAREQKKLGVILDSTGASANISKEQIGAFGEKLQKTTNFSKEMTTAAAGALAPFARSMSGDMFKGVLKAAADVSSVMGGDLSERAAQLGMAMQNPQRAMKMLRTLGIQFSETQKEQLANYQKTGDAAGAQAMILAAVNAQFAGDAEKMASPMTMLKNQLTEVGIKIGSFLLPYVRQFASVFITALDAVVDWLGGFGSNFSDVIQTAQEAWAGFTGWLGDVWQGIMSYLGVSGGFFSRLWAEAVTFLANSVHNLAFVFRNFGLLSQLAIVELVSKGLELFPSMEVPIIALGAVCVGTWAGIGAFFSNIIENMIGGLKELLNFGKAVGAGIAAAWSAITAGNFKGAAGAMADAFVKELASQEDVKAPNAFAAFGDAYKKAADDFSAHVAKSGGLGGFLAGQKADIIKQIGESEAAFELRKQQRQIEQNAPPKPSGPAAPGAVGGKLGKEELPKAAEFGSEEAFKEILRLTGETPEKDEYGRRTAEASERTAAALEHGAGAAGGDGESFELGEQ